MIYNSYFSFCFQLGIYCSFFLWIEISFKLHKLVNEIRHLKKNNESIVLILIGTWF